MIRRQEERGMAGFTLLEVLLVIVIIGILLGVALPMFLNHQGNAPGANAKSKLDAGYKIAASGRTTSGAYASADLLAHSIQVSEPDLGTVPAVDSVSALPADQLAVVQSGTAGPDNGGKNLELAYKDTGEGTTWVLRVVNGGPPLYSSIPLTGGSESTGSYQTLIAADNPISYWTLGDQIKPVAVNSVAGAPNGTYNGGITLNQTGAQTGSPSVPVSFNGSSGYVDLGPQGDPANYTGPDGSGWSTELWVRLSNKTAQQFIWGRYLAPTAATGAGTYIYFDPTKGFVCGTGLGNGKYPTVTTAQATPPLAVSTGTWYHIVCELDPSQKTKSIMYVNSTRYVTDWSSTLSSVMPPKTTYDHILGQNNSGGWLNGDMDNVAFYSYPLSAATVAAHYSKGING